MKGINVAQDTHQKLVQLKKDDETFEDLIKRILDMEDKFNPKDDIIYEYEYVFGDVSRLFLVMFGDSIKIKYYSQRENRFESNIRAWNSKMTVPEDVLNSFISFIVKESNLYVLFEMDKELIQNNIHIKRVG